MIRVALGLWIRLALAAAATLTVAAILIARADPRRPSLRVGSPSPFRVLGEPNPNNAGGRLRLFDSETGRTLVLPITAGLSLVRASASPWEDRGRREVVGLGSIRAPSDLSWASNSLGMVRLSVPEGTLIDQVDLTDCPLPSSAPSWSPGTLPRVLYPGGDGRIYRLDFEAARPGLAVGDRAERRPKPLTWRAPSAAAGESSTVDLSWPIDSRLGGKVLVSIYFHGLEGGLVPNWQLWWLELDRDATAVIASGPLLQTEPSEGVEERRLPTLVRDAAGSPVLAYLARTPPHSGYRLRVAPVRFDPASNAPQASEAEAQTLTWACLLAAPTSSPDGRWITVEKPDGPGVRGERLPLGAGPTLVTRLP